MLLDFDEHLYHRRIMQEAFIRPRLAGYVEQMDQVVTAGRCDDWPQRCPLPVLPGGEETHPRHRVNGVHGPRAGH